MTDDPQRREQTDDDGDKSASAIFAAIMREAAEKAKPNAAGYNPHGPSPAPDSDDG